MLGLLCLAGCAAVPPAALPVEVRSPAATTTPAAALEQLAHPRRIVIPALEVDRPLVSLGLTATREHEVPVGALDVGWYRGGPAPGQAGPAIILGHVNWAGRAGSFARLAQLRPGELLAVDDLTFEVYDVQATPKAAFPTGRVYGRTDGPELRLITCGGAFDRSSGSYLDNVIVYARAVPAAPPPQPAR